jgi:Signal transduction histidine kinase
MKNLSLKFKITLWFMILMIIIIGIMLASMFVINRSVVGHSIQSKIQHEVINAMDEVEYDDGEVELDDDIKLFDNDVYITVYDLNENMLIGDMPRELRNLGNFVDNELRSEIINGDQYYIYDRIVTFKKHDSVWVRGITSITSVTNTYTSFLVVALSILPMFIVGAVIGGYQISKNSLKPIEDIITTVKDINEGKDLSNRIAATGNTDETTRLITTFNNMFERLEKSFNMEKQFTQDASHELRTPVSVIMAECDYTIRHADTIDEYKESIETIDRQAKKMSHLINELLSFARLDQNMIDSSFETLNYSDLLYSICDEQKALYPNIELTTDIESDIIISSNHVMLSRVCVNLISNAFTYNKINGNVNVKLRREDSKTILSVEDTGIGISEEDIDKIWDRFYRTDKSRTKSNNLGLGLSMVKLIAEKLHGEISVKSKINEGSTFVLILF